MDDIVNSINGVSETLFLTLYSRAIQSQKKSPIINDKKSVEIVDILDKIFSKSDSNLHQMLLNRKIPNDYSTVIAIRSNKFDNFISDFLSKNPDGIIVNIGCGLDTRFFRIDNKKVEWYDLDMPSVIKLKKHFLKSNDRYHFIDSSVLDFSWMNMLLKRRNHPFLFIAEGVFQYLHQNEVKSLILKLQKNFPGSELVCELCSSYVKKKQDNRFFKGRANSLFNIDKSIRINFGVSKSSEFSTWNDGIIFIEDCSFFHDKKNVKGLTFKVYKFLEKFRKIGWIAHYRLN